MTAHWVALAHAGYRAVADDALDSCGCPTNRERSRGSQHGSVTPA